MRRSQSAWTRLAMKAIFSLVGLALFATSVSCKFYQSASMPVSQASTLQHHRREYHTVTAPNSSHILSLDKRFDLKHAYALIVPVCCIRHFAAVSTVYAFFLPLRPADDTVGTAYLRGPPAVCTIFS